VQRLLGAGADVELLAREAFRTDSRALARELSDFDTLIHLGYRRPPTSGYWSQLVDEVRLNVLETIRLLEAATTAHIEQVCFASSVNVYPPPARGVSENGPVGGDVTPYAIAKLQQEDCLRHWARLNDRAATVLRLATVYGPGETVGRAVPNFIRALLAGGAPRVDGRGVMSFDLVYVDDVAEAFERALVRRKGGVFNIGSGVGRTPRELAGILIQLFGASCAIQEDLGASERGGHVCDVSLAERVLGFRASMPLEDGLRAEIEWLRRMPLTWTA
jgi:nucleoside-diphosphate-sugar epimerase